MEKFEYNYPMSAGGKMMTPITQMIDYLNAKIELYEAATGRKNQTLQNALGFAMNLRTTFEEPLIKGIYKEGMFDMWHSSMPYTKGSRPDTTSFNKTMNDYLNDFFKDSFKL